MGHFRDKRVKDERFCYLKQAQECCPRASLLQ